MKPEECTEAEFVFSMWAIILGISLFAMYSLEWVLSTKYDVGQINNIYVLIVAVLFVLILFFGLVFTFYKVYRKKAEDEIELKRLEILEKTRREYCDTKNKKKPQNAAAQDI